MVTYLKILVEYEIHNRCRKAICNQQYKYYGMNNFTVFRWQSVGVEQESHEGHPRQNKRQGVHSQHHNDLKDIVNYMINDLDGNGLQSFD